MSSVQGQYSLVSEENQGKRKSFGVSARETGEAPNVSISPCVWKLVLGAVFMNACLSLALISIVIVALAKTGAAGGMVPGTVYPSLVSAAQANFDPKRWKDIFDAGANLMKHVDGVDWSLEEKIAYDSGQPPQTCYEQPSEQDCNDFPSQCTYNTDCQTDPTSCLNTGGQCSGSQCCLACSWESTDPPKCTGPAKRGGKGTAEVTITADDSKNVDASFTRFYNALTKASDEMGDPVSNHVVSPLDFTKFIQNILKADWHRLATQCQAIGKKCVAIDFAEIGMASAEYKAQYNAQIHIICKTFGDICGKLEKAFE